MKKILFFIPVIVLLAAGCNQSASNKKQPTPTSTSTTVSTKSVSNLPSDSDIANATTNRIDLVPGTYTDAKVFQLNGIQILSPWSDSSVIKESNTSPNFYIGVQNQENERFSIMSTPQDSEMLNSAMAQLKITRSQMQTIFGKYANNNYNFQDFVYNLTPTYLAQTADNNKPLVSSLLSLKTLSVTTLPINTFMTPSIHGFEFGTSEDKTRIIDFYTNSDVEYNLNTTNLSQKEIDFILSNIK